MTMSVTIHLCLNNAYLLLVIWGQNKLSDQIDDAWILKTNSLKWEQLHLPGSLNGRKWHSSGMYHPTPYEAITITTGGFKRGETSWNCPNHSDTVVIKFGIPTLYNQLCVLIMTLKLLIKL